MSWSSGCAPEEAGHRAAAEQGGAPAAAERREGAAQRPGQRQVPLCKPREARGATRSGNFQGLP